MKSFSTPKTFLIHASTTNGNSGFLRLRSFQDKDCEISYRLTIVKSKSEASRFLNFDSVKKIAYEYMKRYCLENVKIIDFSSGKVSNVKEKKTQQD